MAIHQQKIMPQDAKLQEQPVEDRSASLAAENERLRQENRALKKALRQSQRLASVGSLAAMVVHEFNNILTPLVNYAKLAGNKPQLIPKALDSAVHGGDRATEICQALLDVVHQDDTIGPFNVREMIEETIVAIGRDPKRDGIELSCTVPENLELAVPRGELQQVFLNLILGARTAVMGRENRRSPRIDISAEIQEKQVTLRVSDNGEGIPAAKLGHIFDPDFAPRNGDSPCLPGGGLALAVSREIIRSMRGEITAESIEGVGTIFFLRLPYPA